MSEKARISSEKSKAKKGNLASKTQRTDFSHSVDSPLGQIFNLHQTLGNQTVRNLFCSGVLQPKLKIGQPGDKYESEADRIAEQVMRTPEQKVQRQPEEKEEGKSEELSIIDRFKLKIQCILENDELRNKFIEKLIPKEWKEIYNHMKENEKLRDLFYESIKDTFLPEKIRQMVDTLENNPLLRQFVIQNLVKSLPWDQFLIFLERYILAPLFSVENLDEKTKQFFFKIFSNVTLAILLYEFRTGAGEKERVFDISHPITKEVLESSAVKEALKVFYERNTNVLHFKDLKSLSNYEYKFSPKGDEPYYNIPKSTFEHLKGAYEVASEWDWVELFMGGVFVTIQPGEGNKLNIEVRNDMGRESLMLHAVPNLPESAGKVPYRMTTQRFIFSVLYDPDYLKKTSACYRLCKESSCYEIID